MKEPNKSQWEAICHNTGPAMVIAGPGSGKTFTIVSRIKYLIEILRVPPNDILVITFSKAAAKEMYERFCNESSAGNVTFCTFHSMAYNILKESSNIINSNIISQSEKLNILNNIFNTYGYGSQINNDILINLLNLISKIKNSDNFRSDINFSISGIDDENMKLIINNYNNYLNENQMCDFDDLIIKCIDLLKSNKAELLKYQNKYKYILIDEFQDINIPQYELIKSICKTKNLFVVGDDDQSIYRFRGSSPNIMDKFILDYKECHTIMLTENYRSRINIVNFAQKVISNNKKRISKNFYSQNKGGDIIFKLCDSRKNEELSILQLISNMSPLELENTAIILRTNLEATLYSELLKSKSVPVNQKKNQKSNNKLYFILEDIIAFLSFIYEEPRREYFYKFMNKPVKYIERASVVDEIVNFNEIISYYSNNIYMTNAINTFSHQLQICKRMQPKLSLSLFRKNIGYDKYLYNLSKNKVQFNEYMNYLNCLEDYLKEYKFNISIAEYLSSSILESVNYSNINNHIHGINIMTMHNSKGLEFNTVIIPDVNEGIIPSKKADEEDIEEERRLLYVAITRAKDKLYIWATKERNRKVSRFINNIISDDDISYTK